MQSQQSSTPVIRPLELADIDEVVRLSLIAWRPVFESFENVLGTDIFARMCRPDWQTHQATAVREVVTGESVDPIWQ